MGKNIISFMEISHKILNNFSDSYKKRHPENIKLLKSDDYAIIKGSGFDIEYTIPCDCNCPHCDKYNNEVDFVTNEAELKKRLSNLKKWHGSEWQDEPEVTERRFFIKAVKQNKEIPGKLFKETV